MGNRNFNSNILIGQRLLKAGLLTQDHINNILARQECGDNRRFGEIAIFLKYIKKRVLEDFLRMGF